MGKEEKKGAGGPQKKKEGKKTHRGGRGKSSAMVRGMINRAGQSRATGEKRRKHRQERSTDPSGPVERIIVPQIPHDSRSPAGLSQVHPGVLEYYRGIEPLRHPYLALFEDQGKKWVTACAHLEYDWDLDPGAHPSLCCVVGHLSKEAPPPGGGIKIGHGEFIDYSSVPVDLGYHAFKPSHEVEQYPAVANFVRYMRRHPSAFNCVLWKDKRSSRVIWVKPAQRIKRGDPIVLRDDPSFFVDGTAVNKKEE